MPEIPSFDVSALFDRWIGSQPARIRRAITVVPRGAGLAIAVRQGRLRISGWLSAHELSVVAEHDGECWDFLLCLDVDPVAVEEGVRCRSCPADAGVWATSDELIIDHLLGPFAQWIEEKVLPAVALAYFGGDGATWARMILSTDQSEGAIAVVMA